MASVGKLGDSEEWGVYVNLAFLNEEDGGEKELVFTLIHEFAHILSLNEEQVDVEKEKNECSSYYLSEGCTFEKAYINKFQEKF